MKKFVSMMLILGMLTTISACTSQKESTDSKDNDSRIIAAEQLYTVTEADGRVRMEFTNHMEEYWGDLSKAEQERITGSYVFFSSVAEMKARITSKKLTTEEVSGLYVLTSYGMELDMDIRDLKEIRIPSDTTKEVCWKGNEYLFSFSGPTAYGAVFPCSEEAYLEDFADEFTNYPELANGITVHSQEQIADRNATVVLYDTGTAKIRSVFYDVEIPNGILHVRENYCLERYNGNTGSVSESIPQNIHLLCKDGDSYFAGELYDLAVRPDLQWLASFGIYAWEDGKETIS